MPRKQRNKDPNNGASSQSSATQKAGSTRTASNGDGGSGGFPPHLLRSHSHHNNQDALPAALEPETLVPNAVFVARHALSSKECREWINYAEEGDRWDSVSHPATNWIAHRECGRIQKNDWHMSHRLYQRIESIVQQVAPQLDIFDEASLLARLLPKGAKSKGSVIGESNNLPKYQPVSCNPNLRLYKYTKGQWFGRHVDGSNKIEFPRNNINNNSDNDSSPFSASDVKDAQTEITVLFYLSSCRGGATRFHLPNGKRSSGGKRKNGGGNSEGIAFTPEEGAVLLHVHGDRCLEHEAEPVLKGDKYVLRTDIVYGIM